MRQAAAGHPAPKESLAATATLITEAGSTDTASIYRDLTAGHAVEVEHIFGGLLTRARALGVATPLLDLAAMGLRVYQHRRATAGRERQFRVGGAGAPLRA